MIEVHIYDLRVGGYRTINACVLKLYSVNISEMCEFKLRWQIEYFNRTLQKLILKVRSILFDTVRYFDMRDRAGS